VDKIVCIRLNELEQQVVADLIMLRSFKSVSNVLREGLMNLSQECGIRKESMAQLAEARRPKRRRRQRSR